jgi:magnesium-transporting ATPase (P-type)
MSLSIRVSINHLLGAAQNFRKEYSVLSSERKEFFTTMCRKNAQYLSTGKNCQQEFAEYREHTLQMAQAAYLVAVVLSQVANILIRKTQVASIFSFDRLFQNTFMLASFVSEFVILIAIVYIPGLNTAFLMNSISAKHFFCAAWIMPFLILWDEARKFLCRLDPKGFFTRYSNF